MADTIDKLRELSSDAETRRIVQAHKDGEFFARYERAMERAEGREEGRQEGRDDARRETACRLLGLGIDRASIRVATELSDTELDELVRDA